MTQVLRAFSYGQGGLGTVIFALFAAWALPRVAGFRTLAEAPLARRWVIGLWGAVCASVLAEFVLTSWYLLSPGYQDQVEASVASSVHALMAGDPLYPSPDSYTLSSLLYGPLLAELNSLGYVLFHGAFAAKLVGWLAGWLAVLLVLIRHIRQGSAGLAALAYSLVFLMSFGAEVTVARPEPLLLLFAAASLAVALEVRGPLGVALKVHGPLYLLPALSLWTSRQALPWWDRKWVPLLLCFGGATVIGLSFPFLPHNVSVAGYLRFLALAAKHGLAWDLLARNCAFVAGMWAPIVLLNGTLTEMIRTSRSWRGFALVLFVTECLVAVVASKPGAGVHHFLPFLVSHALLFQQVYVQSAEARPGRAVLAVAAAVLGMIIPTVQTYGTLLAFDLRLPDQTRQRDELLQLASRYPGGMIGVAGSESYSLASLRPWLTSHGALQTDYGAFMDLQFSGLDDTPLQRAFDRCEIPFVYMPKPGAPFTLQNNYDREPLFSDSLRDRFSARYSRAAQGTYFDVFGCSRVADAHSQLPAS
jgi:hypothetical protein